MNHFIQTIKSHLRELDPDLTSDEWSEGEYSVIWEGQIECESWKRNGIDYESVNIHTDKCLIYFNYDAIGEIELLGKYLQELSWTDQTH